MNDMVGKWQDSIALKMTAAILWGIVIISIIIAVIMQKDAQEELENTFSAEADHVAYITNMTFSNAANPTEEIIRRELNRILQKTKFTAFEFIIDEQRIIVGNIDEDNEKEQRDVQLHDPGSNYPKIAKLDAYHPAIKQLIDEQRIITLATMGLVFMVIGIVLALLVKALVIKPIHVLVDATQKVSHGDMQLRLNSNRSDEFGTLAAFFNNMLENVTKQQEQLKHAVEESQRANKAKSSFLANMSHELRTPLNAIIGYSELIQEDIAELGQKQCSADIEKIRKAGKHLLSLINEVLDISKIEAGKMDLYIEEFEIGSLVTDVAGTVEPLLKKNGNQITIDIDDNIGSMKADVTKVRQTLLNLLSNACKFTKEGQISLSVSQETRDDADHIKFMITDTGIGMSLDQKDKLFNIFTQADVSTTRKYGGTGLGLAISKRFCEMMGGSIEVDSIEGEGSVFTVHLPVECNDKASNDYLNIDLPDAEEIRKQINDDQLPVGAERRKRVTTILVIDDDSTVHELVKRNMTAEGFNIVSASNGKEGLELVRKIKPDVITLDVMMSEMDGWNVLMELKGEPELADIPVIMMTMIDKKDVGYAMGVSEYLVKPVSKDRLLSVVKKCVRKDSKGSVLIVEPDAKERSNLSKMMEENGFSVIEAKNGNEALTILKDRDISTLMIGITLNDMDSFEFVNTINKTNAFSNLPVIVIAPRDLPYAVKQELQNSVALVMHKTDNKEEFIRGIRRYINADNDEVVNA